MKPLQPGTYRIVRGDDRTISREVWGFRTRPLARATLDKSGAHDIAREFLAAHVMLLRLRELLDDLREPRILEGLGGFHVLFRQNHLGLKIHRAFVTVHMDRAGRVYLVKESVVPKRHLSDEFTFRIGQDEARSIAKRHISSAARGAVTTRVEPLWYWSTKLILPAWKVRVHRAKPRSEWIVFVDAATRRVLHRWDNLALAKRVAPTRVMARLFDPNPVVASPEWEPLRLKNGRRAKRPRRPPPEAYRSVIMRGLDGSGHFTGRRASTKATRRPYRYRSGRFVRQSGERGFNEAMAYYHVDSAIAYVERLGYRGTRRIFPGALEIDAHFTREDQSYFSSEDRVLRLGYGGVDDAEDAEVILHELGHAIQDFICRDFGQSPEAAAMGEGFGDYFAASFFAKKKPAEFRDTVMSWDGVRERGSHPPCARRMDAPRNYDDFKPRGDEHNNGKIWSATLWDIRNALEPKIADTIIIESHYQLDGWATMASGARAIIDAARNLKLGRHSSTLISIFRHRRIGPVE